jgi:predicted DNA-binding protein (MmcQ/YjbR family)
MGNMERLEAMVVRLPGAVRVDIEAWGGEPTFRVGGKNFIFAAHDATSISVKLPLEEAAAVVASDPQVQPTGYGLGRHGWVSVSIPTRTSQKRWREIEEWIRTSYTLVAPKRLARLVLQQDAGGRPGVQPT